MEKPLRLDKENLIYLGLWSLLFLAPVASLYFRTTSNPGLKFQWGEVFHVWIIFAAYFAIFLIHNFVLAPLLIYKHKTLMYLATLVCLVAVFILFECMNKPRITSPGMHKGTDCPPEMRDNRPVPPEFKHDGIQPGEPGLRRPDMKPDEQKGATTPAMNGEPRAPEDFNDKQKYKEHEPPVILGQADIIGALVQIGLLSLNLGVKLFFKNEQDQKDMQELEKKNLKQQLEYLKYQINPHFFMNTLNNIHALVDIDPEKAKTTIVELSKMMRYVLYEGDKNLIPLQKEIEFLHNYVLLMKLRYPDKVNVDVDIPENFPDGQIPPLLLITFVENAFKHGVSYKQKSFINISMDSENGNLLFKCLNSKKKPSNANGKIPSEGGVGLKNVKQRLDLIYADDYCLTITDSEKTYEVLLCLPIKKQPSPSV